LEGEIKNVMITQGNEEFAFKVIDGAIPPQDRFSPSRKLLLALGLLIGAFGSLLWFLLRDFSRRNTNTTT
jgi:uncharacterized protein involved in exopolysaccharide biosynthesis